MSDRTLTHTDLRLLRDILDLTRPDHPETPQERTFQLLEHLGSLTGCNIVSLQDMDSIHRRRPYCQLYDEGARHLETEAERAVKREDPGVHLFWECWWTSVCSLPERLGRAVVVSDRSVFTQRQMRSDRLYVEYLHYVDEILVGYPTGRGRSARLILRRDEGSPFGHRELMITEMLLPHLRGLVLGTVPRAQAAAAPLTGRETEILRQVARGLANREVARAVGISEATVRKHLENSYQKLGVQSRTGAVAELFGTATPA